MNSSSSTSFDANSSTYSSHEAVFVLPLIPLIDFSVSSSETEEDDASGDSSSSSASDSDFLHSSVEAMD